ncbi:MAG: hypothetical protein CME71_12645 [Halobacteriovorax sp.]|nr:hypothetical protein [Halobacteriovorax sp.]
MNTYLGPHSATLWLVFTAGVLLFLILDVILLHKKSHEPSMKEALIESALWISLGLGFNVWVYFNLGHDLGMEFLTGYLVEKSLSIDNLFIILLVFNSLKIPKMYQHRVLFWGVFGAIVMRAALIMVGVKLINEFHWILYVFGGILVFSGYKLLFDKEHDVDIAKHWSVKLLKKFVPVTYHFHGDRFLAKEGGVLMATPMMAALVLVEATDLIFAVDSIPAVFAVTKDPFIAFSSNIMAVMGLRALYFVLATSVGKLRYLKPGLAVILFYIGVKMLLLDVFNIPSHFSLMIIVGILATAGIGSWYADRNDEKAS